MKCVKIITGVLTIIIIFNCEKNVTDPNGENVPGSLIKSNTQKVYTTDEISGIFSNTQIEKLFNINYDVEVVTANYYTTDHEDNIVVVSGAIFIPLGQDDLKRLSIQHGTESKRDLVASVNALNSVEGVTALLTASMGYLTVIPDYIGFGVSQQNHPYLHANSLVPSIIDMLKASNEYCSANDLYLTDELYLTGYSEGGYATLAAQKEIEELYANEYNLVAVAPLSGPYDLVGTFKSVFSSDLDYPSTAYVAYFLKAYNDIYEWNRLDDMIHPQYVNMIPNLFNGSKTWAQIENALPKSLSELIKPDFVNNISNNTENDVISALSENTVLDWKPKTPQYFVHGDQDRIVPYQNTITAIQSFQDHGSNSINLYTIPGGTHESSGPEALIQTLTWFENISPH